MPPSRTVRCRVAWGRSWRRWPGASPTRAVRNRGTIGGSLAHADPAADWIAVLPALGGDALAWGPAGERRIPLAGFMRGLFTNGTGARRASACRRRAGVAGCRALGPLEVLAARRASSRRPPLACWLFPGQLPRAVLGALDAPPLIIADRHAAGGRAGAGGRAHRRLAWAPGAMARRAGSAPPCAAPWRRCDPHRNPPGGERPCRARAGRASPTPG